MESWERLDPHLGPALRAQLPQLADEVIAAIREAVPEYARPLEGGFGRAVRTGTEEALARFVEMVESGRPRDERRWRSVYVNLGRGELREGRSLESLLAAYRVGARAAWRRLAAVATAAGAGPETLTALAEGVFAYIDELSALSAEGYAAEQAAAAGESQRRRRRLVGLLLEAPPAPPAALDSAAAAAGWRPAGGLAAVAMRGERPERVAVRLGPDVIAATVEDDLMCAIVPDPAAPGRRDELAAALGDRPAALGPPVERHELARSFARARAALELGEAGILPSNGVVAADEHLAELLAFGDRALLREHAERELAPLSALPARSRQRLLETLRVWLDHPAQPTAAARTLHLHPQTVRYRVARLRELLGDDLDDPERRFALTLAVRGASLLA
jgi:PucR C-terminal helix-turn-helix domain